MRWQMDKGTKWVGALLAGLLLSCGSAAPAQAQRGTSQTTETAVDTLGESRPMVLDAMMEQRWDALEQDTNAEEQEALAYRMAERMALHRTGYKIFVWGDASQCDADGECVPEEIEVRCQVLRICDIELQLGERVNRVLMSDTTEWEFYATFSGVGRVKTPHLAIRARGVGPARSNMMIYTNRRVYHMQLQRTASSSASQHMPLVAFHYPEEFRAQWELRQGGTASGAQTHGSWTSDEAAGVIATDLGLADVDPRHLDFRYEVEAEGRRRARRQVDWAPLRAFDDGEKTIIEMPLSMLRREAPILLVRQGGRDVVVNYRIVGNLFVVDRLFAEAVLVKGVGRGQERVVVRRVED